MILKYPEIQIAQIKWTSITDFNKLRELVIRFPWEAKSEGKGVRNTWLYFKDAILRAEKPLILTQQKNGKYNKKPSGLDSNL